MLRRRLGSRTTGPEVRRLLLSNAVLQRRGEAYVWNPRHVTVLVAIPDRNAPRIAREAAHRPTIRVHQMNKPVGEVGILRDGELRDTPRVPGILRQAGEDGVVEVHFLGLLGFDS